jgi:hypothetical protein
VWRLPQPHASNIGRGGKGTENREREALEAAIEVRGHAGHVAPKTINNLSILFSVVLLGERRHITGFLEASGIR